MTSRVFLAVFLLFIGMADAAFADSQVDLRASFAGGGQSVTGPLTVTTTSDCTLDQDNPDRSSPYHETLSLPGQSVMTAAFRLDKVPGTLYIMINARTKVFEPDDAKETLAIFVNQAPVRSMVFSYDQFVTIGIPIARYCHAGDNSVEMRLPDTAQTDLWVRDIAIEQSGSFTAAATAGLGLWNTAAKSLLAVIMLVGLILMSAVIDTVLWRGIVRNPVQSARLTLLTLGLASCAIPLALFGLSLASFAAAVAAGVACAAIAWKWQAG